MQAFASMVRKVCICDPSGDEQWIAAMRAAGLPENEIRTIFDTISKVPEWVTPMEGGSGLCQNYSFCVAASVYRNSWFSTEGLSNVVKTNRGSGAGTPLADIIFALTMSRVLVVLREQL